MERRNKQYKQPYCDETHLWDVHCATCTICVKYVDMQPFVRHTHAHPLNRFEYTLCCWDEANSAGGSSSHSCQLVAIMCFCAIHQKSRQREEEKKKSRKPCVCSLTAHFQATILLLLHKPSMKFDWTRVPIMLQQHTSINRITQFTVFWIRTGIKKC